MNRVLGALVLGLWAGCASAPEFNYYTLDMRSSGLAKPTANIEIAGIRPAEALARPEILIQAEPTRVEYYATDRWVSGIGSILSEKLLSEFGAPDSSRQTLALDGDVLAFGQIDTPGGAEAYIKVELSIRKTSQRRNEIPLFKKTYERKMPAASASPADVVKALSSGVEAIAAEVAQDIARIPSEAEGT